MTLLFRALLAMVILVGCTQKKADDSELPLSQSQQAELASVTDVLKEMDAVIRGLPNLGKPVSGKPTRVQSLSEALRGCSVDQRLPQEGDANLGYLKLYRRVSGLGCPIEHDFSVETFRASGGNRVEQVRAQFQVKSAEFQTLTDLKAFRFEAKTQITSQSLGAQTQKVSEGTGQGSIDFVDKPSVGIRMVSKEEVKISTGFQEGSGYQLTVLNLPGSEIQAVIVERMNGVDMATQAYINQKEVKVEVVQNLKRALLLAAPF